MIIEIGTSSIPPRISLSALRSQLGFDPSMHPLRHRLGRFDRKAVGIVRLRVFVGSLKLVEMESRLLSDGDNLERNDVHVARIDRPDVIGEAESLAPDHSRKMEARDLA